jgi:hypothetical protein
MSLLQIHATFCASINMMTPYGFMCVGDESNLCSDEWLNMQ